MGSSRWTWLGPAALGVVAVLGVFELGLLSLFGFLQMESREPVTLPSPTGPYPVGRALFDWSDGRQADPLSPGGGAHRELAVWAWYPASPTGGGRHAPYLPPAWQQAVQGTDFLHTRADAVTTHGWPDAPVADGAGPYPTVLFLPGAGRDVADYTTLAEDLASHGYAVFGVDPTYVSRDVVLAHGRVVEANRQLTQAIDDPARRSSVASGVIEGEAGDLRFALGRVDALEHDGGQRFQGRLDTSRVAFFGHSIGGAGAARACQLEPRCAGAVNLDGAMWGPVTEGVGKPFLFVGEDPSTSALPAAALRGALRNVPAGRGEVLSVRGAGHLNFSDVGVLYRFPPGQLGLVGSIDGRRALTITSACLRAFLDAQLRGQPGSLLSDPARRYPEVQRARGF